METLSKVRAFGGVQGTYRHASTATNTAMTFSVFVPAQAKERPLPVVYFLSGLTCDSNNVTQKGEYRRACSELGLIFVASDTSPRGEGVADDADGKYDFGLGASFYVDATVAPFSRHYRMWTYVQRELPAVIAANFPVDPGAQGVCGHSMGGHGALTLGLRHPEQFRSVSAFAPIVAPSQVTWGQKALRGYLGPDSQRFRAHDAVALVEDGARCPALRVDQGTADEFLQAQLRPELLEAACKRAKQPLDLRFQPGYDHSYYFVSSFMASHLQWHADALRR